MEAALSSSLGRTILGTSILTIGRARDNGLVLSDPTVSSRHAEIRPDGQGYSIVDLGSTNGTFVNEQRLTKNTPLLLHAGDMVRIGNFTFTYEEKYPTSWRDTTNATQAIDETTGKQSPSPSSPDRFPCSVPHAWDRDDEKEVWRARSQAPQAPSSPPTVGSPAPQSGDSNDPSQTPTYSSPPPAPYIPPTAPAVQAPPVYQPSYPAYVPPYAPSAPQGVSRSSPPKRARPRNLAQEHLQFTAFHPRIVPVETWNTLLVYTYIESALQAIRADAARFKDKLGLHPGEVGAWASRPLSRGIQITVVPTFRGVIFNPESITFSWEKDWHPTIFSFNAHRSWAGAVGNGEVTIFTGPLILASLKISLRLEEQAFHSPVRYHYNQEEASVSPYRKIFASYSHDDTPIVLAIRKAAEVIGDESLMDSANLRSGQNWNPSILRLIDHSDIFQLFWSNRSANSIYVRQECEYALQHNKYDGFIRPVYWEKPMRPPPHELSHLHFAYYELSQKNFLFSRFFSIFRRE
jgi:pSer/pThr/pTyr-binding forkhead associated (FHA) protein